MQNRPHENNQLSQLALVTAEELPLDENVNENNSDESMDDEDNMTKLIFLSQALGYPSDSRGLCQGVSTVVVLMALKKQLGRLKNFSLFIQNSNEQSILDIYEARDNYKNHVRENKKLEIMWKFPHSINISDEEIIQYQNSLPESECKYFKEKIHQDIKHFAQTDSDLKWQISLLDNLTMIKLIEICQQPYNYYSFFNKLMEQSYIEEILDTLMDSPDVNEKILHASKFISICDYKELKEFFSTLFLNVSTYNTPSENIVFLFSVEDHICALVFEEDKWLYCSTTQFKFFDIKKIKTLVDMLIQELNKEGKYLTFTTFIFTLTNAQYAQKSIYEWVHSAAFRAIQKVTPEKLNNRALIQAYEINDLPACEILLKAGDDAFIKYKIAGNKRYLLNQIILQKSLEFFNSFVKNIKTNRDKTLINTLNFAIKNDNVEFSEALVNTHHTNINLLDEDQQSPLFVALLYGKDIAYRLASFKDTLINIVCKLKKDVLCDYLEDEGIDTQKLKDLFKDRFIQLTEFQLAVILGNEEIVNILLKKDIPELYFSQKNISVIEIAKLLGHKNLVNLFHKNVVPVNPELNKKRDYSLMIGSTLFNENPAKRRKTFTEINTVLNQHNKPFS